MRSSNDSKRGSTAAPSSRGRRGPSDEQKLTVEDLRHPIFGGVEPAVTRRLLERSVDRCYRADDVILVEREPAETFFVLHKGSVRVFYTAPDGLEVVAKLFRAPAAFGEMECLTGIHYLESVQALEKSRIVEVPREAFISALRESHVFTLNMLKDVAARLCVAAQNERSLAFSPVETRLANLFSSYIEFYGLPAPDGILIRVPLTQDDFAHALGAARRSINRVLRSWTTEGIVSKRQGCFVVHDAERLEAITDPDLLRIGYQTGAPLRVKAK